MNELKRVIDRWWRDPWTQVVLWGTVVVSLTLFWVLTIVGVIS